MPLCRGLGLGSSESELRRRDSRRDGEDRPVAQPMIATCGVLIDATVSTILLPNHFGEAVIGG